MTQLFGHFSAPTAPVHLPGAAFFAAAALATASCAVYWVVTRPQAARLPEPEVVTP